MKAAAVIRRVLQKLRVAQPETIAALQNELNEALEQELEHTGSMKQQMQDGIDKTSALAQKRVEQIVEQRKKHEESIQEREKAMTKFADLVTAAEASSSL